MSRFWIFIAVGFICFAGALVFARLNIVVVGPRYYPSYSSSPSGGSATGTEPISGGSRTGGISGYHSVDEIRGWAPDVTNAGASAGFA